MNNFRYQLERYIGRSSRYVCPQCGRKYVFTRYVDTHNNNTYLSDNVGKCNRLDKCGYHYTPRQYFEDNPWLRDNEVSSSFSFHRKKEETKKETPPPPPEREPYGTYRGGLRSIASDITTTFSLIYITYRKLFVYLYWIN